MQVSRKMIAKPESARTRATPASHRTVSLKSGRLKDILAIANEAGLLRGTRTKVVRGRMPEALVNKAKARTGIKKDTDLLEVALANLAVADDFPEWLLSQKGTVSKDIDLEF